MRKRLLKCLFWLVWLAHSAAAVGSQGDPRIAILDVDPTVVFRHPPSGIVCPPSSQGFERIQVARYDAVGADVSCGYNHVALGIALTIYAYPSGGKTLDQEYLVFKANLRAASTEVEILDEGSSSPDEQPWKGGMFRVTSEYAGQRLTSMSVARLFVLDGGFFLKVRTSFMNPTDAAADAAGALLEPILDGVLGRGQPAVAPPARESPAVEPPSAEALEPRMLFKRVAPSIVVIDVELAGGARAQGSGVVVSGGVVTNYHVVEHAVAIRVRQGQRTWPAEVAHADPSHDLVQLAVPALAAPIVPMRVSTDLETGEPAYAIGAPRGLELTLSDGLISGLRPYEGVHLIQTSAPISPGSSGGGLFDDRGRLIGITTKGLKDSQSLNFAHPVEWIEALRKKPASVTVDAQLAGQAYAWYTQGNEAYDRGEFQQAVEAYRQALRIRPDATDYLNNLGNSLNALERYAEAEQAFREALRIDPSHVFSWNGLGITFDERGQYERAVEAYRRAIEIKPDYAGTWNNLGGTYSDLGEHAKAIEACRTAIRFKPDLAEAWNSLGSALYYAGDTGEAVNAFRKAIRLKPDYLSWTNLGAAYDQLGELREAIQAFEKALDIQPEHTEAWSRMGGTYVDLGEIERAIASYREALRIDPDYAEAWSNLGRAYGKIGQEAKEIEAYRRAVSIRPNFPVAWHNLGHAYRETNDFPAAIEAYHKALQLKPDYAIAWVGLAGVHLARKDYVEAKKAGREATRLDPKDANGWINLGIACYNLDRYDEAIRIWSEAARLQPDSWNIWYKIGAAASHGGDRETLQRAYRRLKELNPKKANKFFKLYVEP